MSHGKIRDQKNCLNCGHQVEHHFCGHCGQENVETRQPFHYLFTHFFEDFTHYDGQFWGTLKNLFFNPGKLTNIYLEGKKQRFVPPVKLYIFVSFVTFLVPNFLPNSSSPISTTVKDSKKETTKVDSLIKNEAALTENVINIDEILTNEEVLDNDLSKISIGKAKTKEQFDSLYANSDSYYVTKPIVHKLFDLGNKKYSIKDLTEKFVSTFTKSLPKVLFIYLPIFAFFLWVFHDKKKWWYFDHGVFTLHYFSFLLLTSFFYMIGSALVHALHWTWLERVGSFTNFILFCYTIVYFYKAHKLVYKSSKNKTLLITFVLFCVNVVLIISSLIMLMYYSFLSIT